MKERRVARMILLDPDNKILLLKIDNTKGSMDPKNPITKPFWIPPGGGIEKGETMHQALLRELKEETGIEHAKICEPAAWYGEIILERNGIQTLVKQWFFVLRVDTCDVTMAGIGDDEKEFTMGVHWWSLKEIQSSDEIFMPYQLKTAIENLLELPPKETKTIDLSVKS